MLPAVALLATAAAACGGSSSATQTASAPARMTQTPAAKPDSCVVGTWKSTGLSGTESYTDVGGGNVPLSGGGGAVMTIQPDGSLSIDYSSSTPATGTGSDGAAYVITTTGTLAGRVTTGGGELTEILGSASSEHITVTKNGSVFRGGSLQGAQVQGYQCSAGKHLALTEGGVTEIWVPS